MPFDVKKALAEIADDLKDKAQDMLDASQIDDRVAAGFRRVADALDGLAGRTDRLDTDETTDDGGAETDAANRPRTGAKTSTKES